MIRIALAAIFAIGAVRAQPPPPLPALAGSVMNSVTGEPVRKAMVLLRAHDESKGMSYTAESDGKGRFLISDLDPGIYSISAERQGFMLESEGAPGAPQPSIPVEAGKFLSNVIIKLVPLGVISGRVLDEDGDPIRGAEVKAMAFSYQTGKKQLRTVNGQSANDKGEFRLFGLRPGTIYLSASERIERRFPTVSIYNPTFFPGTTDVTHATPIEVSPGVQLRGFDILLRPEKRYVVRGKLPAQLNPDRQGYSLELMPRSIFRRHGSSPYASHTDAQTFEFLNVLPGSYVLTCTVMDGDKTLSARQAVEVANADVEGITLNLVPLTEVPGVVRVEGTPAGPLDNLQVILLPEIQFEGDIFARVKPDKTFVIEGVTPDAYEVTIGNRAGSYLKAVRFGDEEAPDRRIDLTKGSAPVTVLLGTDVGDVEGTVRKANGDPAVRARVTVIASGKNLGRHDLSVVVFTDEDGKFHAKSVAPGDYKIFAWEDVPEGAPEDPDFRKPYEKQGVPLKMDPNGHQTIDLTAIASLSPR